jgi:GAF domain-containing protein
MPFLAGLGQSLRNRENLAPCELANGDSLERVLSRHLLAVEEMADGILTSILLLDPDGKRLWHGSAPNLPPAYCRAIDGIVIGPSAGSCGTAAYCGDAVYVADIATDPLWADYRDLALEHDLRACWSTPIRDPDGAIIGTFAIYHRTVGGPTRDEIEAIAMITGHVAQAITLARGIQDLEQRQSSEIAGPPVLAVAEVADVPVPAAGELARLMRSVEKLQSLAEELDRAAEVESDAAADNLKATAADCRRVVRVIRGLIENYDASNSA